MEPCCNRHAITNAKKVSVSPTRQYTGGAARARLLFTVVILQALVFSMFGWSRSGKVPKVTLVGWLASSLVGWLASTMQCTRHCSRPVLYCTVLQPRSADYTVGSSIQSKVLKATILYEVRLRRVHE